MTDDEAKNTVASRVSRETFERLDVYADQLTRWQKTINLVAPNTIKSIWSRHILDSVQLWALAPSNAKTWLDIGSGAGFPGLVIAMIAEHEREDLTMTLIESDLRKCGFVREVARQTGIKVNILTRRIEDAPPQGADVISARALAALPKLIVLAERHAVPDTTFLFPKGAGYRDELAELSQPWQTKCIEHKSITEPDASILEFRATLNGDS